MFGMNRHSFRGGRYEGFRLVIFRINPFHLPVLIILFLCQLSLRAQLPEKEGSPSPDILAYVLKAYGIDQELIHGTQYYNRFFNLLGDPFFRDETSLPGSVVLEGREYNGLLLNYDIFRQCVILEYLDLDGGRHKIILPVSETDAFSLGDNRFEKTQLMGEEPRFYQFIEERSMVLYIYWSKGKMPTVNNIRYAEYFSEPARSYYLLKDGDVHPFSGRRSFSHLFEKNKRREVRTYLRKNMVSFKNASVPELKELMDYISNHITQPTGS